MRYPSQAIEGDPFEIGRHDEVQEGNWFAIRIEDCTILMRAYPSVSVHRRRTGRAVEVAQEGSVPRWLDLLQAGNRAVEASLLRIKPIHLIHSDWVSAHHFSKRQQQQQHKYLETMGADVYSQCVFAVRIRTATRRFLLGPPTSLLKHLLVVVLKLLGNFTWLDQWEHFVG